MVSVLRMEVIGCGSYHEGSSLRDVCTFRVNSPYGNLSPSNGNWDFLRTQCNRFQHSALAL